MNSESTSRPYADAGVDITAGYEAVRLMSGYIKNTEIPGVLGGIGGFGGLFEPNIAGIKRPVFVSGTDGVGTKLKLAFLLDRHDTIGIDCVAMCVNDIVCSGAKPLFFLDYIALGKNIPERVASIVKGVTDGCIEAGCALIGGETAEMPGFYKVDEYDLAGFSVGMVDYDKMLDRSRIKAGDALISISSSGVHSNGFSLIRKSLGINDGWKDSYSDELSKTIGEELLTPTKIYVRQILSLIDRVDLKAVSHITGGGFYENVPRMLGANTRARIEKGALTIPPVFDIIAKAGGIEERDMFNTFNMGTGMVAAVAKKDADRTVGLLRENDADARVIGEIITGEPGVEIW